MRPILLSIVLCSFNLQFLMQFSISFSEFFVPDVFSEHNQSIFIVVLIVAFSCAYGFKTVFFVQGYGRYVGLSDFQRNIFNFCFVAVIYNCKDEFLSNTVISKIRMNGKCCYMSFFKDMPAACITNKPVILVHCTIIIGKVVFQFIVKRLF